MNSRGSIRKKGKGKGKRDFPLGSEPPAGVFPLSGSARIEG